MNNKNIKWLLDYEEFLNAENTAVPENVNHKILAKLKKLVNPSAFTVFYKVLGIHTVVSFLSLSICHQFGLNPFNTETSLSDWMMQTGGHHACMVGCGILFVGLSLFLAGYFLSLEEVAALKRTQVLQTLSLGVISLSFLIGVGAQVALTIGILWFVGAMIGGLLAVETNYLIKVGYSFSK